MFFLENGMTLPVDKIKEPVGVEVHIYEVLRVIAGKPLFWEDHFSRLKHSCDVSGVEYKELPGGFHGQMIQLIELNQIREGNIRFDLFQMESGEKFRFTVVPHSYPSDGDYLKGVSVGLLYGERQNPEVKVVQQHLRDKANRMIAERNYYEVLLVDHEGYITEGSKSNVFFIHNDRFFTPPHEKVLPGITRMKVMDCIDRLGYTVEEVNISLGSLPTYDAVFLTGTSPKVLPVSSIESVKYYSGNVMMRALQQEYDSLVDRYLKSV